MRIVDGKLSLGKKITIEMEDGSRVTRKIQTSGSYPSIATMFVTIDKKKVNVGYLERAEATLDESEQKLMDELQRTYNLIMNIKNRGYVPSKEITEYYTNSELFVQNIIGHDIVIRDGKVTAIVG